MPPIEHGFAIRRLPRERLTQVGIDVQQPVDLLHVREGKHGREEVVAEQRHDHQEVHHLGARAAPSAHRLHQATLQRLDIHDVLDILAHQIDVRHRRRQGQHDQVGIQAIQAVHHLGPLPLPSTPVQLHDLMLALARHPMTRVDDLRRQGRSVGLQPPLQVLIQPDHEIRPGRDTIRVEATAALHPLLRRLESPLALLPYLGLRCHAVNGDHQRHPRLHLPDHQLQLGREGGVVLGLQRLVRHASDLLLTHQIGSLAVGIHRLCDVVQHPVEIDRERVHHGRTLGLQQARNACGSTTVCKIAGHPSFPKKNYLSFLFQNIFFWWRRKIFFLVEKKNIFFGGEEKYFFWWRRKIFFFGEKKNIFFWWRRKIFFLVEKKNIFFWWRRKIFFLVEKKNIFFGGEEKYFFWWRRKRI